jgi:hypothetical protein
LGVEPGVAGGAAESGIAGTGSDGDDGASAGFGELEGDVEPASASAGFALPRDDEEPSSLDCEVGASVPQAEAVRRLVITTRSMAIKIQTEAVTTVIFVKVSPALVPNALDPPTPPNAPASPPPFPRWIRIKQIRKSEVRMINVLKMAVKTPTG